MIIKFKKIKIIDIVKVLTMIYSIITIVYNSGYLLSTTDKDIGIYLLMPITFIFTTISLYYIAKNRRITLSNIAMLIMFFLYINTLLINQELSNIKLYINYFSMLIFAYSLTQIISFDKFIKIYTSVIKIITIISLVVYSLTNYFDIKLTLPIIQNANNIEIYNGILFFVPLHSATRNQALFWEPGLFSTFLIIAMIFEISFKEDKINLISMVIFTFGLLTTKSTAGYILYLFIIILWADKYVKISKILVNIYTILLVLIYAFYEQIINGLIRINPLLFNKFLENGSTLTTRKEAPILNLEIFSQNIFAGAGLSNSTKIFIEQSRLFGIDSQTSTSTFFMASLGILGVSYTLFWILSILNMKNKSLISKSIILLVFMIILNKEPHSSILITYCILFFFIKFSESNTNKYINKGELYEV